MGIKIEEGETNIQEVIPVVGKQRLQLRNTGCPIKGVWVSFMFEVM
jgi:hypothetical protein